MISASVRLTILFIWTLWTGRETLFCEGSENVSSESSGDYPGIIHFTHEVCQIETVSGDEFGIFYDMEFLYYENVFELLVRLRGPSDGHIFLTPTRNESGGGYLVVLGSFGNTQSEIRRSKWSAPVFKMNTPGIMSEFQFRGFVIRYNRQTGKIRVYSEGNEIPLLHWRDEKPLPVHFVSFSAYFDVVVHAAFNCHPKDRHALLPMYHNNSGEKNLKF